MNCFKMTIQSSVFEKAVSQSLSICPLRKNELQNSGIIF